MSGAESTYAKFSDSPLVRCDNSNFSPALYNKVGALVPKTFGNTLN